MKIRELNFNPNLQLIENYFDNNSKYWDLVYQDEDLTKGFSSFEARKRREIIHRLLAEKIGAPPLVILDCGCGAGVYTCDFISLGHTLFGVDISLKMLIAARDNIKLSVRPKDDEKKFVLVKSDVEHLPFSDRVFNVVYSIGVLQYLTGDRQCMSEISRVIKTGGYVLVTLPNILRLNALFDPYYYIKACRIVIRKIIKKINIYSSKLNKAEINSDTAGSYIMNRRYFYRQLDVLFRDLGLEIIKWESVSFGPLTFAHKQVLPLKISQKLSNSLKKMADRQYLSFLNMFATRWVILLRKVES